MRVGHAARVSCVHLAAAFLLQLIFDMCGAWYVCPDDGAGLHTCEYADMQPPMLGMLDTPDSVERLANMIQIAQAISY